MLCGKGLGRSRSAEAGNEYSPVKQGIYSSIDAVTNTRVNDFVHVCSTNNVALAQLFLTSEDAKPVEPVLPRELHANRVRYNSAVVDSQWRSESRIRPMNNQLRCPCACRSLYTARGSKHSLHQAFAIVRS